MPPDLFAAALIGLFSALVICAGLYDISSYTIPNWISLALIGLFFPAAFAAHLSLLQIGLSLGVGVAFLALAMFMFAMNWVGGGDAKLLAAASLWIGWPQAGAYLVITGLAGGALALTLLAMRSAWVRRYAHAGPAWLGRLATPDGPAPYGVAIAAGALLAFPNGVFFGG
jgi:prepilin peptidase CpaA